MAIWRNWRVRNDMKGDVRKDIVLNGLKDDANVLICPPGHQFEKRTNAIGCSILSLYGRILSV